jgi:hypothetical protein
LRDWGLYRLSRSKSTRGRRGLTISSSPKERKPRYPLATFPASKGPLKMATLFDARGNEDEVFVSGAAEGRAVVATTIDEIAVATRQSNLKAAALSLARCMSSLAAKEARSTRLLHKARGLHTSWPGSRPSHEQAAHMSAANVRHARSPTEYDPATRVARSRPGTVLQSGLSAHGVTLLEARAGVRLPARYPTETSPSRPTRRAEPAYPPSVRESRHTVAPTSPIRLS